MITMTCLGIFIMLVSYMINYYLKFELELFIENQNQ